MFNETMPACLGIAVMGGSRGGEVALLLGSMFPDVKAVVAYSPSHVVWGGWPISDEDRKKQTNRPAWTYKGKPVAARNYVSSVWVNRDGKWLEASYHETPLGETK